MPDKPHDDQERDVRTIRLYDLAPHEWVHVECLCRRIVEFPNGLLQRKHKIPSDCLIYDLQYRFRCASCGRDKGFRISVTDRRGVHNSAPVPCIVVVECEAERTGAGVVPPQHNSSD